jgi:hypothetical protein
MNNINLIRSETTKGIHVIKGKALIDDILSYSICRATFNFVTNSF